MAADSEPESPPAREAWIETTSKPWIINDPRSPPAREAWIETLHAWWKIAIYQVASRA